MLKEATNYLKEKKKHHGLQLRFISFLFAVVIIVISIFSLLLVFFGLAGNDKKLLQQFLDTELRHFNSSISYDFDKLSQLGLRFAENISLSSERFFYENNVTTEEFLDDPQLVEEFFDNQMDTLLSIINNNTCGGIYIVLDTSVNAEEYDTKRSGIFVKKTQPASIQNLFADCYCLRGPANHGLELFEQWQTEFNYEDISIMDHVLATALNNPDAPLSRLYYWAPRKHIHDNSEDGMLLCVPLRNRHSQVYGICGIEVSDVMFRQLYSPDDSYWKDLHAILAPGTEKTLLGDSGIIASNTYMSDSQLTGTLTYHCRKSGFPCYTYNGNNFGGVIEQVQLYPADSPYSTEKWYTTILMPQKDLVKAARGGTYEFINTAIFMLVLGLIGCILISHHYIRPIKKGITNIHDRQDSSPASINTGFFEIDLLFEDLAQNIREQNQEIEQLNREKEDIAKQYKKAQNELSKLSGTSNIPIDPDTYEMFVSGTAQLTKTQREIFNMYLEGKKGKEIIEIRGFTANALKWHNREIYSKLGVSSLKELLAYGAVMKEMNNSK